MNNINPISKFQSREVNIGNTPLGGDNPIRIQSMTTIKTMDTIGNVEQSIRLIKAGCDYVRITASTNKEAENLALIKEELSKRGYNVPLIADVHFNPKAAEISAAIVEKVRINPGNYVDRNTKGKTSFTDEEYNHEIEKIRENISPLIKICKKHGTAMRIGSNHGSLSERIMSRYGDTAEGMVEAAMEFVYICRDFDYHNIVLSMKSSNTRVMLASNRLLIERMLKENLDYPIHLGVTEAGAGVPGRIKSSIGAGTLLFDGIGDTIRVSLTEDPVNEVPVAIKLVEEYSVRNKKNIQNISIPSDNYMKFKSSEINNIGGKNVPVVISDFSNIHNKYLLTDSEFENTLFKDGFTKKENLWVKNNLCSDYFYVADVSVNKEIPKDLFIIQDAEKWQKEKQNVFPLFYAKKYLSAKEKSSKENFILISYDDLKKDFINKIKNDKTAILVLETKIGNGITEKRQILSELEKNNCKNPVILKCNYKETDYKSLVINSAVDFGALFIDDLGDGIWMTSDGRINASKRTKISFDILQASRVRFSKTEYISCPSCGRTQYNIKDALEKIRERTQHLKGLTIGVMGCIVNGPGEMSGADYGYVGSGKGKITLFKAKEILKKNIDEKYAVDELINIIKENGDWQDAE